MQEKTRSNFNRANILHRQVHLEFECRGLGINRPTRICTERSCLVIRTLIYQTYDTPCRTGMNRHLTDESAIMILLLTVSLLSFVPVRADQGQAGTVVFHLTGQATPFDNATTSPSGSATLDLVGNLQVDGNGGLAFQNLTGNLQVNSENYTITTGHGDSNKRGEFVIFGETGSGELILHGIIQNNQTVTVDSPPSRISSLAYLSLSGSMSLDYSTNESLMSTSVSAGQNISSSIANSDTSFTMNGTSEATQLESTSSVTANTTSLAEAASTSVIANQSLTGINNSTTVTELSNETVSNALPGPTAFTVTTTQLGNQTVTIFVTQTVANSTLTTTSTVANATITQITVTTVANTTVIVTNSTNSPP
jgi:hypothetical protein